MKNTIVAETPRGYLVWCDLVGRERVSTRPSAGRYAHEDDTPEGGGLGAQYPQVCVGGRRTGNTIVYADREADIPKEFAKDLLGQLLSYEAYCQERDRRASREATGLTENQSNNTAS